MSVHRNSACHDDSAEVSESQSRIAGSAVQPDVRAMSQKTRLPDTATMAEGVCVGARAVDLATEADARKLRVLFLHDTAYTGAPFAVHADLMRFFDRQRVEVAVAYNRRALAVSRSQKPDTSVLQVLRQIPDIELRPVEFGPSRAAGLTKRQLATQAAVSVAPTVRDGIGLVRHLRRTSTDVIHCCADRPREAFLGVWLARMTGAKCVLHMHLVYGDWMNPLARWAIQRADGVIGVSSWTSESLKHAGLAPERIFTVHNGIDLRSWDPEVIDGADIRREFDVEPETALLVMVAALRPWKGHKTLLEALQHVTSTHRDVKLLIVGEEDMDLGVPPGSYTEELKRLVVDAQLERHVVFTGQRRDIRQILAAADLFTMPTYADAFCLAILEAMAMGKPIVAVTAGGVPELVADGESGLLTPAGDSAGLARSIVTLLDNPHRRKEMGASGRRRALEHFTAQQTADGVERVYRALARTRPIEPS
jgi:glycosyltransferase involved in cell wall biosynthesis